MSGAALATFVSCNKAGAAQQYAEYLTINPNDYEARFKKAYCHEVLQDFDQAREEYREIASRTQFDVREVANALARATNRDERSRSECTEALRLATRDYDSSLAWHYFGESLRLQGDSENAIDAFEKAAARDKYDMWNKTLLAETLREHGLKQTDEYDREQYRKKAKTQYMEVVNSSKSPVTLAHAGLALCHLAEGQVGEANKHMKIAHETNPTLIPTADPVKYRKEKGNGPFFRLIYILWSFQLIKFFEGEQECLAEIARSELVEEQESKEKKPRKIVKTRRIGPSGKPMIHVVRLPNRHAAEDAARNQGHGNPPIHHAAHQVGQRPHFHAADKAGEKIRDGVHFEY